MKIPRKGYNEIPDSELILRDWLAIDRTSLANERTLLAYVRTGLALAIVGGSLLKFFDSLIADVAGVLFLLLGFATISFGFVRFLVLRGRLNTIGRRSADLTRSHRESSACS